MFFLILSAPIVGSEQLYYNYPMHVISKKTLREYWEDHANIRGDLEAWYDHVRNARWSTPSDIQKDYRSASILPDNRVVFNLKGNQYRLVVRINYEYHTVFIRFVGTHADYDRIDATKS